MKKIVFIILIALGLLGCNKNIPTKVTSSKVISSKVVTLLGTYTFDVESGKQGLSTPLNDFFWQRVDSKTGNLMPQNGTTVEITKKSFELVDKAYMKQFPIFRDGRVSSSDIKVGKVVMFKTAEGNYGKLRIKGFRSLHDFDFKEAQEHISPSWKKYVLKKPNTKKYHLIIEYKLYK